MFAFFDILLIVAAGAISVTYLIEIEAICLIDVYSGDRERLVAKALEAEKDFAALYGLPVPTTADDPSCQNTTGNWLLLIMFGGVFIFLGFYFWLVGYSFRYLCLTSRF